MRILIAEDEPATAKALKLLLEKVKYTVDIVHNGTDAWEFIRACPYEVIVLDIMMPGMSGFSPPSGSQSGEGGTDSEAQGSRPSGMPSQAAPSGMKNALTFGICMALMLGALLILKFCTRRKWTH